VNKGIIGNNSQMPEQPRQTFVPQEKRLPETYASTKMSKAYVGLRGQVPQFQNQLGGQQPNNQFQNQPATFRQPFSRTQSMTPTPFPQKKSPKEKINDIIQTSAKVYKKTIDRVNPEEFENEDDMTNYIATELVKNLRSSDNKHLRKYL
jgi:hypothetical protein